MVLRISEFAYDFGISGELTVVTGFLGSFQCLACFAHRATKNLTAWSTE